MKSPPVVYCIPNGLFLLIPVLPLLPVSPLLSTSSYSVSKSASFLLYSLIRCIF